MFCGNHYIDYIILLGLVTLVCCLVLYGLWINYKLIQLEGYIKKLEPYHDKISWSK